jgi:oxygen-independent coproporphyrinogen-3 oxidase
VGTVPGDGGRRRPALHFVYFGGGTPSFLSTQQLQRLVAGLKAGTDWSEAAEVTFECEPGTLSDAKLALLRELGVTRLSLGVENFDDRILELNGRAHRSPEIYRVYEQARRLEFPQINIDLIAGMIGESDANWRAAIDRTIELSPDSVTIYQMELPFNTTISGNLLKGGPDLGGSIAGWAQKRRWVTEAFEALEAAGYHRRQRVHGGEGSGQGDVRLPRQPVGGRRSRRARRGVVRSRQRRPPPESRHLGTVCGGDRSGRAAARARLPAKRR